MPRLDMRRFDRARPLDQREPPLAEGAALADGRRRED